MNLRATACALLLGVLAAGCGPTTYPADVFPEMHYQPSDRRLEPPREAPPEDAVPVTGSTPRLSFDDATPLTNPVPATPQSLERAQALQHVNCAACHGPDGHGQGPVAAYFSPVPPVDFRSDRVRNRTDGQLFWIIANGLGNMPAFRDLLSEQDLWTVVLFVRQSGAGS
ncbi:MAG: cytochrome c [Chloroflexota bacterium]|nr:cytochrome c [Chloroflexota bacterium]